MRDSSVLKKLRRRLAAEASMKLGNAVSGRVCCSRTCCRRRAEWSNAALKMTRVGGLLVAMLGGGRDFNINSKDRRKQET